MNKLVSFGQSNAEESRRLRAKSALVEGGVSRTPVFCPAFSLRACMYTTLMHSAQLMTDSRSHDTAIRQTSQESEVERVPVVVRTPTCCSVCPGLHARCTDVFYTRRYTDGGIGCCSGYGKVWRSSVLHNGDQELWTRVHSPVVRAVDCRSAGTWSNSGWRHWIHIHWHVQRNNIMSPITTTITMPMTTIPRKSVNKNTLKKKHLKEKNHPGRKKPPWKKKTVNRTRILHPVLTQHAHFQQTQCTDVACS